MKVDCYDNYMVMRIGESIVSDNVEEMTSRFDQYFISGKSANVVLDFKDVEYLSSVALKELVVFAHKLAGVGKELAILSPTERIVKLFKFTKLDCFIGIFDSEDEMMEYFSSGNGGDRNV